MKLLSKKRLLSLFLVAAWSVSVLSIVVQNKEALLENNLYLDSYFTLIEFDLAVHEASEENPRGSFYYDTGSGFNEGQVSFVTYEEKTENGFYHYSVKLPEFRAIEQIRFDPLEGAGSVTIKNVVVRKFEESELVFKERPLTDDDHSIESLETVENGLRITTNGDDPYLTLTKDLGSSQELSLAVVKEMVANLKLFGAHEYPLVTMNIAVMETAFPEGNKGRIYFDTGSGFTDDKCVVFDYRRSLGAFLPYTVELPSAEKIKRVGFKPLTGPGKILLQRIDVDHYHQSSVDLSGTISSAGGESSGTAVKKSSGVLEVTVQGDSIITIVDDFDQYQRRQLLDYFVHPELRKLTFSVLLLAILVCLLLL